MLGFQRVWKELDEGEEEGSKAWFFLAALKLKNPNSIAKFHALI